MQTEWSSGRDDSLGGGDADPRGGAPLAPSAPSAPSVVGGVTPIDPYSLTGSPVDPLAPTVGPLDDVTDAPVDARTDGTADGTIDAHRAAVDVVDGLLDEVEHALARLDARLDDGTYGRCEACGTPIPDTELAEQPLVLVCSSCGPVGLRPEAV